MVVLLDLDDDDQDPYRRNAPPYQRIKPEHSSPVTRVANGNGGLDDLGERENPNLNSFSAALGCYPIISQVARCLDLNTLHALSRTCRQIKANLTQYRKQLIALSLRCENEAPPSEGDSNGPSIRDQYRVWLFRGNDLDVPLGRLTSGRIGACARDMVDDCRRCGRIVCRNCTMKPPPASHLSNRHRRLCTTCLTAPLFLLTNPLSAAPSSPSSVVPASPVPEPTFTASAFARSPCTCPWGLYICKPCGLTLSKYDTSYKRVWTWRTRYSTYLGGLGTGIGEGNEGVQCGREGTCLGARDIIKEVDCGDGDVVVGGVSRSGTPTTMNHGEESNGVGTGYDEVVGWGPEIIGIGEGHEPTPPSTTTDMEKAGYIRQEIEGIGGVVKKKFKKRVRVGKTVREYEDEREKAEYMGREIRGENRSWCGWCGRVVLGSKDVVDVEVVDSDEAYEED